jgi:hypothetical protein
MAVKAARELGKLHIVKLFYRSNKYMAFVENIVPFHLACQKTSVLMSKSTYRWCHLGYLIDQT